MRNKQPKALVGRIAERTQNRVADLPCRPEADEVGDRGHADQRGAAQQARHLKIPPEASGPLRRDARRPARGCAHQMLQGGGEFTLPALGRTFVRVDVRYPALGWDCLSRPRSRTAATAYQPNSTAKPIL